MRYYIALHLGKTSTHTNICARLKHCPCTYHFLFLPLYSKSLLHFILFFTKLNQQKRISYVYFYSFISYECSVCIFRSIFGSFSWIAYNIKPIQVYKMHLFAVKLSVCNPPVQYMFERKEEKNHHIISTQTEIQIQ